MAIKRRLSECRLNVFGLGRAVIYHYRNVLCVQSSVVAESRLPKVPSQPKLEGF